VGVKKLQGTLRLNEQAGSMRERSFQRHKTTESKAGGRRTIKTKLRGLADEIPLGGGFCTKFQITWKEMTTEKKGSRDYDSDRIKLGPHTRGGREGIEMLAERAR